MAGLYERMTAQDQTKISIHTFGAAMREVARERRTLAQLVTAFNLDAEAQTELTAIRDTYTAATTANKPLMLTTFEDAFILAEAGFYTKAQVRTALGF